MFTVRSNITFILDNNITLQGHSGNNGSMVYVYGGTFKMNAGSTITGNGNSNGNGSGGGVYIYGGIFEMIGGTMSGNTARNGGGVYVEYSGSFTMRGGTITGNTAHGNGGGIFLARSCNFTKTDGTITGYNSDQINGNVVKDADGYILARKGHAVFVNDVNENTRKETTAGPKNNLSYGGSKGTTGAWDK